MSINATNNSSTRELTPAGNHIARCYQMIEIGTVNELIMGKSQTLRKVRIGWELPLETREFKEGDGEKPFVISKEYTLSMHEKSNLRKDLKSWRGRDFTETEAKSFDITKLMGVPCMLNIIHQPSKDGSRVYANISGVTPMPKGVKCPPQFNDTFELSYDEFDQEVFETLPDFIKDKMKGSLEYAGIKKPNEVIGHAEEPQLEPVGDSDDLPF